MFRFKQIVIILFIDLVSHLKGEDEVHEVPTYAAASSGLTPRCSRVSRLPGA